MTADDLYWNNASAFTPPSLERVERLRQAAAAWTAQGHLFAAGMAFSAITGAGWGLLDRAARLECVNSAIAAFRNVAEQSEVGALDGLVAFVKWGEELRPLHDGDGSPQQYRRDADAIAITHAARLVSQFGEDPDAISFLVRGFRVSGPVTGPWTPDFPDYEVNESLCEIDIIHRHFRFYMPSAFRLLTRIGDYLGAREICSRYPSAFTSASLRGWSLAVEGLTNPTNASDVFHSAAAAFEQSIPESDGNSGGGWSSVNRDLWAPYFRSRSEMARAIREPERVDECISAAAGYMPPFRSYAHTGVHRYHLFVRSLAGLMDLTHGLSPVDARREFEEEIRSFGATEDDPAVLEFIHHAHAVFEQLRADRGRALSSVFRAVAALDRVPLVGKLEIDVMLDAIARRTIGILDGPNHTWIHRELEKIKDERGLHRILLRLFQNSVPRYAQVRHGPIEYGKDIAVAAEDGDQLVLRMYQAKCGDIKKGNWSKIRPQLEEIFQVPLETLQIPLPVHRRVGILVWNGHVDPYVDPVMEAWKLDQLTAFQREYEFMHLDDIVGYILDNRLVSAFRQALKEETGSGTTEIKTRTKRSSRGTLQTKATKKKKRH